MVSLNFILAQPADVDVFDCRPDDPCRSGPDQEALEEVYRLKQQIARAFRPGTILEFGVRAGYAAAAFLAACPAACYLGIGRETDAQGGATGRLEDTQSMLRRRYPEAWIEVYAWDRTEETFAKRLVKHWLLSFDLIHVVGHRSAAGCRRDLALSASLLSLRGSILVDTSELPAGTRPSVERYLRDLRPGAYQVLHLPAPPGDFLLCPVGKHGAAGAVPSASREFLHQAG